MSYTLEQALAYLQVGSVEKLVGRRLRFGIDQRYMARMDFIPRTDIGIWVAEQGTIGSYNPAKLVDMLPAPITVSEHGQLVYVVTIEPDNIELTLMVEVTEQSLDALVWL